MFKTNFGSIALTASAMALAMGCVTQPKTEAPESEAAGLMSQTSAPAHFS